MINYDTLYDAYNVYISMTRTNTDTTVDYQVDGLLLEPEEEE